MNRKQIILALATITTGLSAGVFYTFSVAVNPALSSLSDASYINAMQAINTKIENPAFFLSFFGAAVALPLATYMYRKQKQSLRFKLLALSAILYIVGVFGVTSSANVPLNTTLAKVQVNASSPAQLQTARANYESTWNNWHTVRTVAGVASLAVLSAALIVKPSKD